METADLVAGLGISVLVAGAIGIIKSIVAPMPEWTPRLLALVFTIAVVAIGIAEGAYELTWLEAIALVIAQTAEVIGIRELTSGAGLAPSRNVANLRIGRPDSGG